MDSYKSQNARTSVLPTPIFHMEEALCFGTVTYFLLPHSASQQKAFQVQSLNRPQLAFTTLLLMWHSHFNPRSSHVPDSVDPLISPPTDLSVAFDYPVHVF